jgi:hypothetical protein
MAEIYELDAPDYERYEVDWLQNNNRGSLNTDFVKWFNNEKELLNTKVNKQLINFKNNLLSNVARPFSGPTRTNFTRDFQELEKVLSKSIDNARLGPAGKTKVISVAENLAHNEMEKIQSTLISQGFDGELLPDGGISVPYYDENSKYTPKDSWVVKNEGRQAIITHTETGLKLQLDRNGLSFVDDNNFKINNKKINYESIFNPLEDFKGPAYDAQTQDADLIYEDNDANVKNQVDAPGNIKNYSMKGLDFLGKAVAPIDEIFEIGIPKLFAGTALAPFAQSLIRTFRQLALVNLGVAVTKGLYESDVMGENYQNLLQDPDNPEYIAERERLNQEGIQAFSDHMSTYDPSIRFIDSFTEDKLGFNQTDPATKVFGGIRNLFGGIK